MRKGSEPAEGRIYFGIKEEHLTMALMAPLIFACMMTDPILVSVENFNNGQPWALLTYSGAENQSFDMNISKYVVQGNWSEDGIFREFTIQMCPVSGSPSNLIMFFPETGNHTLLHAGTLTECVNATVDTSGFDSYFLTHSGTLFNPVALFGGGMPTYLNLMMLREPRIYDSDELVIFTLLWPYAPADEVHYRCFDGDSEHVLTTPAKTWHQTVPIPPELLPLLSGGLPINLPVIGNMFDTHSTIWDMPCPAYGVPGIYTARAVKVHTYLNNITWPEFYAVFDDFNTSEFNSSIWEVHLLNGSIYPSAQANGELALASPVAPTGILAYYANNATPNSTERFDISANISTAALQGQIGMESAGVFGFMGSEQPPMDQLTIITHVSNMIAFNATEAMAMCDPISGPVAMTTFAPGYHVFRMNSSGNDVDFYLDGAFLGNCSGANGIFQTVYFMMSPDPLTDMWSGNISVDWVNVSIDDFNGATWDTSAYYDDFDSLGPAWDILNNSIIASSGYENDWEDSMLRMSSYGGNLSGITIYHTDPVVYQGSGATGLLVNATFNRSSFVGDGMAALFLATQKSGPEGFLSATSKMRGAILFNDTDYLLFCAASSGSPDITGTFNPGDPDELMMLYDPSGSSLLAIGHDTLTTCTLDDETLYLGVSSDPFTDIFQGNISFDSVGILSFNLINVTGWRWYDSESLVWGALAGSFGYPTLELASDVLVRDCADPWNCEYAFDISSDSAGSMNVSIVNITYENLLGYESGMPTATFSNSPVFSWMASNSTVIDSEIRYQSSLFDSRVVRSDIILSDLYCTNVTDSTVHAGMRLSEIWPGMAGGLPINPIRFEPNPCGVISGSTIQGAVFFGGSVYNSEITGGGGFMMDIYDAVFDNYTLRSGMAVLNVTRYGANLPAWLEGMSMDNDSLDLTSLMSGLPIALPIGCDEGSIFAMEGFPAVIIGSTSAPFACWIQLYDIHLVFDNMSITGSTIGGPTLSLMRNASFTVDNQSSDFNLMMVGEGAHLLFNGLSTSGGPLTFDSEHQRIAGDIVSMDSAFYGWLDGTNVTIVFEGVPSFNGEIYYYDGFTDDPDLVFENGTLCNESTFCHGVSYDAGARTLTFNVTEFSSYAYLQEETTKKKSDPSDQDMSVDADSGYVGERVSFLALDDDAEPLSEVAIRILDPDGLFLTELETDFQGMASFVPSVPGTYRFSADKEDFFGQEGSFPVLARQADGPGEEPGCASDQDCAYDEVCEYGSCVKLQPGECGFFAAHAWQSYDCCDDAACGEGYSCVGNSCVEVPPEQPPVAPAGEPASPEQPPASEQPLGSSGSPIAASSTSIAAENPCCLGGICIMLAGICWYWWLAIAVLLLAALAAATIFRKLRK